MPSSTTPPTPEQIHAWRSACFRHDNEALRRLLAEGMSVETEVCVGGYTVVHDAATHGALDLLKTALDLGANPNARTTHGETPLHLAPYTNEWEDGEMGDAPDQTDWALDGTNAWAQTIRLLVDAGASLEARNAAGWTPLHQAAFDGSAAAVRTLLDLGAMTDVANEQGQTPKDLGIANGRAWLAGELWRVEQQALRASLNQEIETVDRPMLPLENGAPRPRL